MDTDTTAPDPHGAESSEYAAPCIEHVLTAEDLAKQALYGDPASPFPI